MVLFSQWWSPLQRTAVHDGGPLSRSAGTLVHDGGPLCSSAVHDGGPFSRSAERASWTTRVQLGDQGRTTLIQLYIHLSFLSPLVRVCRWKLGQTLQSVMVKHGDISSRDLVRQLAGQVIWYWNMS